MVAYGPASTRPKSATRSPDSAPSKPPTSVPRSIGQATRPPGHQATRPPGHQARLARAPRIGQAEETNITGHPPQALCPTEPCQAGNRMAVFPCAASGNPKGPIPPKRHTGQRDGGVPGCR
ncbi:hypothetical protein GCM10009560_51440 [Nonomuraea longicatena]|uniref:Uncharacterized protein n=1 Tax=Nonomuraea longicatena TaxID=83682 RepID=A0ABN1QBP9_9ACTN